MSTILYAVLFPLTKHSWSFLSNDCLRLYKKWIIIVSNPASLSSMKIIATINNKSSMLKACTNQ